MFFTNSIANLLKRSVASCSKCGVGGKSLFSEWCARKRTVAFFSWQLFPAKIDLHFSDGPMFLDRRNQTPKERKRKENWHFVTDLLLERKEREEGEFICQDEEGPLYASVNDRGVWEIGVKKSEQLHLRIAYKTIWDFDAAQTSFVPSSKSSFVHVCTLSLL